MAKASKKKPKDRRDPIAENHSKIVPGDVTGEHSTSDFIVFGHSTGSQTSEMDALSKQVSLDASDDHPKPRKRKSDWEEPDRSEFERHQAQLNALAEENRQKVRSTLWIAAGAAVGLVGLAAAGYFGYSRFQTKASL